MILSKNDRKEKSLFYAVLFVICSLFSISVTIFEKSHPQTVKSYQISYSEFTDRVSLTSQKHFISESRQNTHARGPVSTGKIVQSLKSVKNADSKQLNQFQELSEPPILQHFNKSKTVYFIHIPKTGGSTLHKILPMVLQRSGTKMKSTGGRHSDWSVLEGSFLNPSQPFGDVENLQVITQLRNPIDRSISQFYQQPFVNKMARRAGTKVAKQLSTLTFNEYLNNSSLMLKTSTLFRDGSSCVYWLAGLHPDFGWCKSSLKSAVEENRLNTQIFEARENKLYKNKMHQNKTLEHLYHKILLEAKRREDIFMNEPVSVLLKAAERLKSTFWFGILEDTERSLELLKYQLGYHEEIVLTHENLGAYHEHNGLDKDIEPSKTKKYISQTNREFLEKLLPMDIWLYDYAKNLFEARWQLYKFGKNGNISVPKLPIIDCIVTSLAMKCKSSDLFISLDESEGWAGNQAWNELITENDSRFLKWF